MNRMITVKGIGRVSAKPNLIVLTISLQTKDLEYEMTVNEAAISIN